MRQRNKTTSFVLKNADPKSKEWTPVYLRYACKDGVMRYSTGQKVAASDWQRKKPIIHGPLKAQMRKLEDAANDFLIEMDIAGKEVLMADLYNHLAMLEGEGKALKGEDVKAKADKVIIPDNTFFADIQSFIDKAKAKTLRIKGGKKNGQVYSPGALRNWSIAKAVLQKFNPNMSWNITMKDYDDFIDWCNKPEQNFRPLYTGNIVKLWKKIMNLGLQHGLHSNGIHQHKDFSKPTEDSYLNKIYLNEAELEKLINLELIGFRKEIRDAFVFNCYTGHRISDAKTLTMEDIDMENELITIFDKKTNTESTVPLTPYNKAIIDEYGGIPRFRHENVINRYIKEIAKEAGIDDVVKYTQMKGGMIEKVKKFKHELVCCHTARRSFATNALKDLDFQVVQGMTGHKKPEMLNRYNRISSKENAMRAKGKGMFAAKKLEVA
jgi:integrase